MIPTIICFTMSAINIPFIIQNPESLHNWASAIICFGLGMAANKLINR